jgi:hypothetical protein
MRTRAVAVAAALLVSVTVWAAGPGPDPSPSMTTFRVTTAEVHITFTADTDKNQPITNVAPSDFVLLRDGAPVKSIVGFRSYDSEPASVLVLTDVSDSMLPGLQINRAAAEWLRQHSDSSADHLSFVDFGSKVETDHASFNDRHMTSLFDALVQTLPSLRATDSRRRAVLLLTDGLDNDSYHGLLDVIALAQRNDIAVYCITAHPSKKQFYRPDLLQALSEETGGRYYAVTKPQAMLSTIADIDNDLHSGYELIFRPDAATAGLHQLSIRPNRPHVHFFYRSAYFQPVAPKDELAMSR